ncbi:hypothetical protein VZT92_011258 [Zoarces viviparus]|uniref:Ig-like domain-containing protein n=1 Tax=Zoarces viviparus TaxID=48416 RepID=A0AAW1FB43_ZOAVI
MSEFRWIKTSLSLILVLQFTAAATGQLYRYVTVRDGDKVTLPCNNVRYGSKNCDSTAWTFEDPRRPAVYLVRDGQIVEAAKDKSDRLSVSEKCSLVIKNVKDEDVGRYDCRQLRSRRSAYVYLTVATLTEHKGNDEKQDKITVSLLDHCFLFNS